jgi:hypothetical protein
MSITIQLLSTQDLGANFLFSLGVDVTSVDTSYQDNQIFISFYDICNNHLYYNVDAKISSFHGLCIIYSVVVMQCI